MRVGGELLYYIDIAKDTSVSSCRAVNGPLIQEEFAVAKTAFDLPEFTLISALLTIGRDGLEETEEATSTRSTRGIRFPTSPAR